jgi:hypothetical protein
MWYIVVSVASFIDSKNATNNITAISNQFQYTSFFLTNAFWLCLLLQLFHWFSKRRLGSVLGMFLLAENLGVIAKFHILGIWEYFPDIRLAENANPGTVYKNLAYL